MQHGLLGSMPEALWFSGCGGRFELTVMSVISEPHTYEQFTTNLAKNTQTHELEPVLFRLCNRDQAWDRTFKVRHLFRLIRDALLDCPELGPSLGYPTYSCSSHQPSESKTCRRATDQRAARLRRRRSDLRFAGLDSCAPQSQTLLTVHGLVDGLYLEGLREKTFRGVEQLALQGLHTGGACSATVTWRSRTTPNWTGTGGQRSKACASRSIQTKRKRLYEFSNATPPAIR
jgi:hypothetical protein